MAGYLDTRQMIIDTLMGRPEGTQIQPEDHQAYALNLLNYVRSVELSSGSTLTGIAEVDTVPIEPYDSRVAYITSVPQNTVRTFIHFKKENNEPITITTTDSSVFVILLWNTQYWEYQPLPVTVFENDSFVGYFECTSLSTDTNKTISSEINQLTTDMRILVKMNNINTQDNATLQIGLTDSKPLYYNGLRVSSTNSWAQNEVLDIYYDGINYIATTYGGAQFRTGEKVGDVEIVNIPGTNLKSVMSQKGATDLVIEYNVSANNSNAEYTFAQAVALVPVSLQKGGLTIKYIDSSTHEYAIKRLMSSTWNTTESNWQGIDNEPTAGSQNLVKSGGVKLEIKTLGYYEENLEYKRVYIDTDGKFLFGIKRDGDIIFGIGIPSQIKGKIDRLEYLSNEISSNEEWLLVVLDSDGKIIEGTNKFGKKFIYGDIEIPYLTERINKIVKYQPKNTLEFQTFIYDNININLGEGIFLIETPINIPSGRKITGVRGKTILKTSGSCQKIFNIDNTYDINIENITFEGDSSITPSQTTIQNIKDEVGIGETMGIYITSENARNIHIDNCKFVNFSNCGIKAINTFRDFKNNIKISDCIFYNNYYGLYLGSRCEYNNIVGCNMEYNQIGCIVEGGNNYFSCCHFTANSVGCVISGIPGINDSHGTISGSSFNHNLTSGITCLDVHYGYCFEGCQMFDCNLLIDNSRGINYNGGIISGSIIITNAPSSEYYHMVHNVLFYYDESFEISGGGTHLSLKNNRYIDKTDCSYINNNN